jgi:hypothetical protein
VTDELFADVPSDPELHQRPDALRRGNHAEDAQLLTGDGSGANITGILATSGIQTQAKGSDTVGCGPQGNDAGAKHWILPARRYRVAPERLGSHFAPERREQPIPRGGPFYAPYGNGQYVMFYRIWGLTWLSPPA